MVLRYIGMILCGIAGSACSVLLPVLVINFLIPTGMPDLDAVGGTLFVLLAGSGFLMGIQAAEWGRLFAENLEQFVDEGQEPER